MLIERIKLMIIMSKAYLDGCPLGEIGGLAIIENANNVEYECSVLMEHKCEFGWRRKISKTFEYDQTFYSKARQIAVMLNTIAKDLSNSQHNAAMKELIVQIQRKLYS